MIKVYFESNSHAEHVATFNDDALYNQCVPALEAKATEANMKLTESVVEDRYKVVSASSPEGLTVAVNNHIAQGWEPIGSHQVVLHHSQNRYSGQQHMDTRHQADYSQTLIRK